MVLPLFGPSTLRDGIMTPVDFFVDPADFARNAWLHPGWGVRIAVAGGRVINFRNTLIETGADKLLADSLDDDALARSAVLQRRRLLSRPLGLTHGGVDSEVAAGRRRRSPTPPRATSAPVRRSP
jgi:ABC-type transporter lipoprotein component MlaA